MEDYFASNLKYLLNLYGERLVDLGEVINKSKETISGYQNGKARPTAETISIIARHYGLTVDALTNTDLTNLKKPNLDKTTLEKGIDAFLSIFPTFGIEKKTGNDSIDKAYSLIRAFQRSLHDNLNGNAVIMRDAFKTLNKIDWDDNIDKSVIANKLWAWFMWGVSLYNAKNARKIRQSYDLNKLNPLDILDAGKRMTEEDILKRSEFIKETESVVFNAVKILKSDPEWADLGDYYLSLMIMFGLIYTGDTDENNLRMGSIMLMLQRELGNKYASFFLDF